MKNLVKLLKVSSLLTLINFTGCTNISNIISNSDQPYLKVLFSNTNIGRTNAQIIIKKTPELQPFCKEEEKYFLWATTCYFGTNPPARLSIQYAKSNINLDDYYKNTPEAEKKIQSYAQSLPASAWKTYTIYPQQIVEKAKTRPVLVNGELKPYDPAKYSKGTNLKLILYIDNQGKVTEEIKHEIIYRNNPAA